ncbi:MAG: cytochrome P450 [Novosphingobium sp.]
MFKLKWFAGVFAAQKALPAETVRSRPLDKFDFQSLETNGFWARLFYIALFRVILPVFFAFMRRFKPVLRIGRLVIVSRYDDVMTVLSDRGVHFPVVYGPEMHEICGGADFMLGQNGTAHDEIRARVWKQFLRKDLVDIRTWSRLHAEALVEAGQGELDVARDLITRTATEVCCRFLGISLQDPEAFGDWSIAVSQQLFADITGDKHIRAQSLIAATHMIAAADDAVARVHANNAAHADWLAKASPAQLEQRRADSALVDRLVTFEGLDDLTVRATLLGVATGFVPTNALSAGNILYELMANRTLWLEAREAAMALAEVRRAGDAEAEPDAIRRLEIVLLDAARRWPGLSPGVFRHCPQEHAITDVNGKLVYTVPADSVVLASVFSGLRDSKVFNTFKDDPYAASALIFGAGPHECLGLEIARIQITEIFAALLSRPGLAPAKGKYGTMWRAGPYPVRLDMRYDCPTAQRALLVAALPVRPGLPCKVIQDAIEALGIPLRPELAAALDATGCIDFSSLNVIETAEGSANSILLVELNGDGSEEHIIARYADAAAAWLAPILAHCLPQDAPPLDAATIAALIGRHVVHLDQSITGDTGLHFDGLPELSVADIARQDRLAQWAREQIDRRVCQPGYSDGRAMDTINHLRRLLKQDWIYRRRYEKHMSAIDLDLQRAIVRPSRKRLRLADWKPDFSILQTAARTLLDPANRRLHIAALIIAAVEFVPFYRLALPHGSATWLQQGLAVLAGLAGAAILAPLTILALFGLFLLLVRQAEKRDVSDPRIASLNHVQSIAAREDAPGYEQNHIIAVMTLKPGLLRRVSFAFTMWWIRMAVTHWFRPGFVVTMGTIHKARWFLVPGTRQFVFHSNYDGSWESYLEDFITRAHQGQSSAWSHGVGFPPTRFLVLEGAQDGDRFKRWVRRQQHPSQCWYSRFPQLTAKQIRNNAMIEDGLARAANDTDARRWLANFGSAQREVGELESAEAQSLVFSGLKHHHRATALAVRMPEDPAGAREWIRDLCAFRDPTVFDGQTLARVRFGDLDFDGPVATLALSAAGLERLGLREGRGLDQLPAAFRMGMHARSRLLGDGSAADWRWSDDTSLPNGADAVLTLYTQGTDDAAASAAHDSLVDAHKAHLAAHRGRLIHPIPCSPVRGNQGEWQPQVEHFGFRDGISQPIIRGSRKVSAVDAPQDVVAPGEFLLGYRNDQGYVSPSVGIGAEHDPGALLPTVAEYEPNRFPYFGNRTSDPDLRDFGRNASFLVLRQFDQDVDGFIDATQRHAAELSPATPGTKPTYPHLADQIGRAVSPDWVAAKIIGRWRDGSPLVGNPSCPAGLKPTERPDNAFAYGIDDPRGIACPLGAHIRRTNPRDSLEPGDKDELTITNRHRILRRGRTYTYTPAGEPERKGLLFAALCSDLERQFEFIQHTWINASSFHGLTDEADPLLGNPLAPGGIFTATSRAPDRAARFTIPTVTGPVMIEGMHSYVTLRGGGYYLLPSRSALMYLTRLS